MPVNLQKDAWVLTMNSPGEATHLTKSEAMDVSPDSLRYLRSEINFSALMLLIALDDFNDGNTDYLYSADAHEKGVKYPISKLLLDSPGASTLKHNRDFFLKRNAVTQAICQRCYPGIAYSYTQLVGAGGRGYRPGAAANSCLYMIKAGTIAELITRNSLPDRTLYKPYFYSPFNLSPADPLWCQCEICGKESSCYTAVYLQPLPPDTPKGSSTPAHPHARLSRNGFAVPFNHWKTPLHATGYLSDKENGIIPSVMENAVTGDEIIFIGLENPQGTVKNMLKMVIPFPEAQPGLIKDFEWVVKQLFYSDRPESQPYSSDVAANEYGMISDMVLRNKISVFEAAINILDEKLYGEHDLKKLSRLLSVRKKIENRITFQPEIATSDSNSGMNDS